MTEHFVFYILLLACVKASYFLTTSTSISPDLSTSTTLTISQAAEPTCFQPRALSDPSALQISSALKGAGGVFYACSNTTSQPSKNNETFYYEAGAYVFGITRSNGDSKSGRVQVQASYCSQQFQNIIDICILQKFFWGGWTQIGNANWSISNSIYPQNLLPLPRLITSSFTTPGQFPTSQTRNASSTEGSSTPASTVLSEDLSRLLLAIEYAASNAQISPSAVAAENPKTILSERDASTRQSQIQSETPFSPSDSYTSRSIGSHPIASQRNSSRPLASAAPNTEQTNISSSPAKPSSQDNQQGSSVNSVSLFTSSTRTGGLQVPTIAPLLGSLVGSNGSVNITAISGSLTVAPNYTITDAFRAGLSTTTVSASNGAVLVYSMQTFSDLANRTGAPTLVQTRVPEMLPNGSYVTFIGGVWVASGGRYWFPPGFPKPESGGGLEPGIEISPPCIWPFCSGEVTSNGEGGGDPEGDPPPPYEPPTPPPAYAPPADENGEETDQETQDSDTQTEENRSRTRVQSSQKTTAQTLLTSLSSVFTVPHSQSSQKTTKQALSMSLSSVSSVSRMTLSTSLSSLSTVSNRTKTSSSTVSSSSMPAYGIANLTDGAFFDYNLTIAEANAAAVEALSLGNAVTVPNGILWAPTGSQELAYAAQATSPFDLALPSFANSTEAPSLSSTTNPAAPQDSTGSEMQTPSSVAVVANAGAKANAVGNETTAITSTSAADSADQHSSSSPIPPDVTPPPSTVIQIIFLECIQTIQVLQAGKNPSIIHTCSCNDGSRPTASKSGTVFACPSQVGITVY